MNYKAGERRKFIKKIGLGAAALAIPMTGLSRSEKRAPKSRQSVFLPLNNGFTFELLSSADIFLGIGAITMKSLFIRSGIMPMFAEIHTPDAINLVNYRLIHKTVSETGIDLEFSVQKMPGDTMEWMLHTVRSRRNLAGWNKEPEDAPGTKLTLRIKPAERQFGKSKAVGFSYQYLYESDTLPIYKITDRASWEIGGSATGNEIWMRNGVVDSVVIFERPDEFYSTEWYLPGIENPNIFQFHPWQTHLQGFSFTCAKEGALITCATEVSHIRSLFEKWRNCNEILHFHEHCNDLQSRFTTSPVEVLWIPGELDPVGRANLYHDVREWVHEHLHQQIGMRRERITTYGIIEEWVEPDMDRYTGLGLPRLLGAGIKTVFIPNQCQNDMNTWGLSNMCCNVDFKISETVGEDKLSRFCQVARDGGAIVEMWGNTAVSTTTERFIHHEGKQKGIKFLPYKGSIQEVISRAEAPFIRNASNAIEADHYTPRFCALNLRDKHIKAYWMKQWKYFHDHIGIGGIFLDSSFNMSSDKFHHAYFDRTQSKSTPAGSFRPHVEPPKMILTQYHAHLQWMVEMQQMGYRYCAEDLGVFGINRTGPDLMNRIRNLSIWADCYCDFNERAVVNAGYNPMDIFFKGLAYRMMWKMYWNIRADRLELGTSDPKAFLLIKKFSDVADYMTGREILSNEQGVLYTNDQCRILWTFTDMDMDAGEGAEVRDVLNDRQVTVINGKFLANKNTVYRIDRG